MPGLADPAGGLEPGGRGSEQSPEPAKRHRVGVKGGLCVCVCVGMCVCVCACVVVGMGERGDDS